MMDSHNKQHHMIGTLFLFCLFGIFLVTSLSLIVAGARIYRNTMNAMNTNYETRTLAAYLTERIRQNDTSDSVSLSSLQGHDALALQTGSGEDSYITYLYFYQGHLMELYRKEGGNMVGNPLKAGEKIMPLSDLRMKEVREHLFSFTYTTTSGESSTILVSTLSHSAKESSDL